MALELTNHTYDLGHRGDCKSEAVGVCNMSEWVSVANSLLGAQDAISANLRCKTVKAKPLRGDWASGKMELTLEFAPLLSIEALSVDLPFKWRMEVASECVTVHGGYHWATPNPKTGETAFANQRVLPVKRFTTVKMVLYGTRSAFSYATYEDTIDHINSDTFLGGAAGTVFFESVNVQMHQLLAGTIIYAVELHLIYKPSGWNRFFREDTQAFDTLLDESGDPVYPTALFAGLLT